MKREGTKWKKKKLEKQICAVWHESMLRCSFQYRVCAIFFSSLHSPIHWHRPLIHVNYRHSKYIVIQSKCYCKRYCSIFPLRHFDQKKTKKIKINIISIDHQPLNSYEYNYVDFIRMGKNEIDFPYCSAKIQKKMNKYWWQLLPISNYRMICQISHQKKRKPNKIIILKRTKTVSHAIASVYIPNKKRRRRSVMWCHG